MANPRLAAVKLFIADNKPALIIGAAIGIGLGLIVCAVL